MRTLASVGAVAAESHASCQRSPRHRRFPNPLPGQGRNRSPVISRSRRISPGSAPTCYVAPCGGRRAAPSSRRDVLGSVFDWAASCVQRRFTVEFYHGFAPWPATIPNSALFISVASFRGSLVPVYRHWDHEPRRTPNFEHRTLNIERGQLEVGSSTLDVGCSIQFRDELETFRVCYHSVLASQPTS